MVFVSFTLSLISWHFQMGRSNVTSEARLHLHQPATGCLCIGAILLTFRGSKACCAMLCLVPWSRGSHGSHGSHVQDMFKKRPGCARMLSEKKLIIAIPNEKSQANWSFHAASALIGSGEYWFSSHPCKSSDISSPKGCLKTCPGAPEALPQFSNKAKDETCNETVKYTGCKVAEARLYLASLNNFKASAAFYTRHSSAQLAFHGIPRIFLSFAVFCNSLQFLSVLAAPLPVLHLQLHHLHPAKRHSVTWLPRSAWLVRDAVSSTQALFEVFIWSIMT